LHKRLSSILLTLALVGGVLAFAATPAFAANPPASFMPDADVASGDVGTNTSWSDVLSDRFDGVDQLAHLTAVATLNIERMEWYACPVGADGGDNVINQTEFAQCNISIGSDTTGVSPTASTAFNPADKAFDVFWDIPTGLDTQVRDILAVACVGAGTTLSGAGQNCQQTLEDNITLDDAAGGTTGQTSTAEIKSFCTRDTDGPGVGANPCNVGGTTQGTTGRAAIDALFKAWNHGDPIPNSGAVVRVSSSADFGAVGDIYLDVDFGADANNDPDVVDTSDECLLIETFTTHKTWECDLSDAQITDNTEMAVWVEDFQAGEGFCAGNADPGGARGDCTLDSHYTASVARVPAAVKQSFVPGGNHNHTPPSPPANAGCDPGETQVKDHSDTSLADNEVVELCMTDQFTDPIAAPFTEETTAPGGFTACTGAIKDHDGNGSPEHCEGATDGAGHAYATIGNNDVTPGTATITSCFEGQPQPTATAVTNHGCANEAANVKDTLTLTWGTLASEVFLAFNDPAPGSASDPCRTGTTFKQNLEGDIENITVCTFDSNGNPVPTDTSTRRLQFTVTGAQGEEPTAIRIQGNPPSETSGTSGQASFTIEAVHEGDNFLNVVLLNGNGDAIDSFSIEKQVHRAPRTRQVERNVTIQLGFKRARGKVSTPLTVDPECVVGQTVNVYKRRRGPDDFIGTDQTNSRGAYGVFTGHVRGRYYARVLASSQTDADNGDTLDCLAAQSPTKKRRKGRRS
jgi:hypothetical protein